MKPTSRKRNIRLASLLLTLLLILSLIGCGAAPSDEGKDDAINTSTNEITDDVMDEGKDEVQDEAEKEPVRSIAPTVQDPSVFLGILPLSEEKLSENGATEPYSTVAYKAEEEEPEESNENTAGGNSSSSSSGSSGGGGSDYVAPGYDPYIPDASKLQCLTCRGDGDCNSCGGSGYKFKNDIRSDCTRCTGGNCPACGGSGTR
ncbi:MAG: hypothetical protein IJA33_02285 [Oscillospiraceae bacterium]|nr:hypothetical protein [Oscillospiraceae bacterium]